MLQGAGLGRRVLVGCDEHVRQKVRQGRASPCRAFWEFLAAHVLTARQLHIRAGKDEPHVVLGMSCRLLAVFNGHAAITTQVHGCSL